MSKKTPYRVRNWRQYNKARPNLTVRTILVDSTGVQVIGGTEWKKMRHKKQGGQLWRKLHVAIDTASQDICAALVTESQNLDGNYMAPLLELTAF